MDRRAQVPLDIPVAADGSAPRRQEYHVQRECRARECRHADEHAAGDASLHPRQESGVEGQQGELSRPQRDVDEEKRDPGHVEEVRGHRSRDAVVELIGRGMDVALS